MIGYELFVLDRNTWNHIIGYELFLFYRDNYFQHDYWVWIISIR